MALTTDQYFDAVARELSKQMKLRLSHLGQKCVNKARDRDASESWYDRTGNLRSSIGFVYYEDGKKLAQSAFNAVLGGVVGSEKGRSYADELAETLAATYSLIVVAGMSYASYVEDMAGKDVLASTEAYARTQIQTAVGKAISDTLAKANKWNISVKK